MEEKFISFLKKYDIYREDILDFIKPKTIRIDYRNENTIGFTGVYPIMENNIIKDIRMVVPYMIDDYSISMNIHEYIHLLDVYNYLNKEYVFNDQSELLPVMYELLYAKENNNIEFLNIYKEHILRENNYLKVLLDVFDLNDNKRKKVKTKNNNKKI